MNSPIKFVLMGGAAGAIFALTTNDAHALPDPPVVCNMASSQSSNSSGCITSISFVTDTAQDGKDETNCPTYRPCINKKTWTVAWSAGCIGTVLHYENGDLAEVEYPGASSTGGSRTVNQEMDCGPISNKEEYEALFYTPAPNAQKIAEVFQTTTCAICPSSNE